MTYPDFQALDPRRALVYLPMAQSFRQDVGENLVVDGNMEAAGTGAYAPVSSAIISKESDAYEGAQCLRIAYGGSLNPYVTQPVFTSSYVYSYFFACRSLLNPARIYYGSFPSYIQLSATGLWRVASGVLTAGQTHLWLLMLNGASGQYVEFDAVSILEHPQVIRSLSQQTGALNYARMGDGHNASTMPTRRAGKGLTFNGSQYIDLDWAAGGPLDTQTFTVVALVQPTIPTADGRIFEMGIAGQRYSLYYDLSESTVVWTKDDIVDQTITSGYGSAYGQPFVVAASISSTQMRLMVDDRVMGSIAGDVRLASFDAASKAFFGQDVAGTNLFKGTMYQAAILGSELNEAQVRECGRRMKQMRNV